MKKKTREDHWRKREMKKRQELEIDWDALEKDMRLMEKMGRMFYR